MISTITFKFQELLSLKLDKSYDNIIKFIHVCLLYLINFLLLVVQ